ncbi:hypothetical protein GCM10009551_032550 [Nocardiopsis tropica]
MDPAPPGRFRRVLRAGPGGRVRRPVRSPAAHAAPPRALGGGTGPAPEGTPAPASVSPVLLPTTAAKDQDKVISEGA